MGKEYKIGDFLKRIKRPVSLDADKEYKLVTIKMKHKGVVLRGLKKGKEIKSNMYEVKKGDFILSGIDARNGAFGIVPEKLDGAIVTNDFWYFEIDENIISKPLFLELTATTWFDEICKKASDGTTQRIRLQKDKFFNQKVILPKKKEQQNILDKLLIFKEKQSNLLNEITQQKQHIKHLKQSLLQDAIQGKLTKKWRQQHPDTEPASELLKRIKTEKEKLIKEKKIRKQKPLPPISPEEIPFELPEGWVWCRLGEIAKHNSGKTLHKSKNTGKYYEYITTSNLYWNYFNLNNLKKIKVEQKELERCTARKGDLLICEGGDVGRSAIWNYDYNICFQNHIHRVRLYGNIKVKYIYYFMMFLYDSKLINQYKKGMGIGNLSGKSLSSIKISLPPLAEQKAIVEKVESIMQKVSAMEEEIQKSEQHAEMLMQAILKEAFDK